MPIEGVSDRVRMPRLGRIRLGEKAENAKGKLQESIRKQRLV